MAPRPVLAVLGVCLLAVGLLAWSLLGSRDEGSRGGMDDLTGVTGSDAPDVVALDEAAADPAGPVDAPQERPPVVPRVLPPDAALEDVRDALVAVDRDALAQAYASIGRLADRSAPSLTALQRQIQRTDDTRVRGVAIVATSRSGSVSSLRFAATRLMQPKRRDVGDVVGAWAALVLGRSTAGAETVTLESLGGLDVMVGRVADDEYSAQAIRFFLDHTPEAGEERTDLIALWIASIERSAELAELLVHDGRPRVYVAALPTADWERLKTSALRQDLSDDARRAYTD